MTKTKPKKSKKEKDTIVFRKQRNIALKLNNKAENGLLKEWVSADNKLVGKNFWKYCKTFFFEKNS